MKKPSIQTIIIAILILLTLIFAYDKWGPGILSSIKYKFSGSDTKDQLQIGSATAKVRIIEYYSYACEYCRAFENDAKPDIIENYVSSGLVKFIFRPVDSDLGEAALCANEQGKFLEYHDSLFRNALNISKPEDLKVLAKNVGMDEEKFWECYASGKYQSLVQGWYNDLMSEFTKHKTPAEERGTPSFIIGSNIITGAQPYSVFAEALEKELAK